MCSWLFLQLLLAAGHVHLVQSRVITFDNTKPRLDTSGAVLKAHDGTTQRFGGSGRFYYHAMGYPACNETGRINGCNAGGHKTCIYGHNNSLLVYSSPDLSSGSCKCDRDPAYAACCCAAAAYCPCICSLLLRCCCLLPVMLVVNCAGPEEHLLHVGKLEEMVYPGGTGGFPECTYFRSQAVYNHKTQKYVLWANTAGCRNGACKGSPNGAMCAQRSLGVLFSCDFVGPAAACREVRCVQRRRG
jgi:hypothetical protein